MKKTGDIERGQLTVIGDCTIYLDGLSGRPDAVVHEHNRFTGFKLRAEWIAANYSEEEKTARARINASNATQVLGLIRERVPNIDDLVAEYKARLREG